MSESGTGGSWQAVEDADMRLLALPLGTSRSHSYSAGHLILESFFHYTTWTDSQSVGSHLFVSSH